MGKIRTVAVDRESRIKEAWGRSGHRANFSNGQRFRVPVMLDPSAWYDPSEDPDWTTPVPTIAEFRLDVITDGIEYFRVMGEYDGCLIEVYREPLAMVRRKRGQE